MNNSNGDVSSEILCVLDFVGRVFCGEVAKKDDTCISLLNPLLMIEQQVQQNKIASGMKPLLFSLEIKTIELKWAGTFEPDNSMIKMYHDTLTNVRAMNANIQLATGMPSNLSDLR